MGREKKQKKKNIATSMWTPRNRTRGGEVRSAHSQNQNSPIPPTYRCTPSFKVLVHDSRLMIFTLACQIDLTGDLNTALPRLPTSIAPAHIRLYAGPKVSDLPDHAATRLLGWAGLGWGSTCDVPYILTREHYYVVTAAAYGTYEYSDRKYPSVGVLRGTIVNRTKCC